MGSIGYVMFHIVGISVLVMIACTIAAVSVPRRRRPDDRPTSDRRDRHRIDG